MAIREHTKEESTPLTGAVISRLQDSSVPADNKVEMGYSQYAADANGKPEADTTIVSLTSNAQRVHASIRAVMASFDDVEEDVSVLSRSIITGLCRSVLWDLEWRKPANCHVAVAGDFDDKCFILLLDRKKSDKSLTYRVPFQSDQLNISKVNDGHRTESSSRAARYYEPGTDIAWLLA